MIGCLAADLNPLVDSANLDIHVLHAPSGPELYFPTKNSNARVNETVSSAQGR